MALSKNGANMIDPYVLFQQYESIKAENDALVQKTRALDIENRCLKNIIGNQAEEIERLSIEMVKIKARHGED